MLKRSQGKVTSPTIQSGHDDDVTRDCDDGGSDDMVAALSCFIRVSMRRLRLNALVGIERIARSYEPWTYLAWNQAVTVTRREGGAQSTNEIVVLKPNVAANVGR